MVRLDQSLIKEKNSKNCRHKINLKILTALSRYGFQDGVSQPPVLGLNLKDDIKKNLTMVVGRERLLVTKEFHMVQERGLDPRPQPAERPAWMYDGTFLVFRKLEQNVKAFQELTDRYAKVQCKDAVHLGAKLMGRWPSGKFKFTAASCSQKNADVDHYRRTHRQIR